MALELQPITFAHACEFIRQHHRHHPPPQGHRFSIAVNDGEKVVGVAVVGRPVARMLDDGWTAEVIRLCTDDTPHVASKLYAACWRCARAMGYKRLITYILDTEKGTSVRAAGWRELYTTADRGPNGWHRDARPRIVKSPTSPKTLFEIGERSS